MSDPDRPLRRVRFFGVHDGAAGWYVDRVVEIVDQFDSANVPTELSDIIELSNAYKYLENELRSRSYTDDEWAVAKSRMPAMRAAVGRYFSRIDDSSCGSLIVGVDFEYRSDLLELLGRHGAFERCTTTVMLGALDDAGLHIGDLLACKKLVGAYDVAIAERLRKAPRNAEYLIRKHLEKDARDEIYLPESFNSADARSLLEQYVDSPDANPNYVGLLETAQVNPLIGLDPKLKLRAKRRNAEMTEALFAERAGFKTGSEVALSETQDEPVTLEVDESEGFVTRFTYGKKWLEQTCDNPSILNNFQHLFEFTNRQVLLVLPAYQANLGVFERFMTMKGKTDYHIGAGFRAVDMNTLLQTRLYQHYLETRGIDLEEVISWFFETYLAEEFGALNFSFSPSGSGTSYLQRARHLFAEMESVVSQFALFVKDGELDRDLLVMSADGVRYKELPSLLPGKYLYPTGGDEITFVLHTLFSDQSGLTYVHEGLKEDCAANLFLWNEIAYDSLHDYQKQTVDRLVEIGVLVDTGTRVRVQNKEQFLILRSMFMTEAVSYFHLSGLGRAEADVMVDKGWATRRASLLTEAEGKYFNYCLNNSEFGNGPALRNKYVHGSQANAEGEDAHFLTYITALKLTLALVIKINDDFCLADGEKADEGPNP